MDINVNQLYLALWPKLWAVCAVGLGVHGQPLRQLPTQPACIERCLTAHEGCFECVKILSQERFSAPRKMLLPFHKVSMHRISFRSPSPPMHKHPLAHSSAPPHLQAHPSLPDPETRLRHHHFLDRPPWVPGSANESHTPGDGKVGTVLYSTQNHTYRAFRRPQQLRLASVAGVAPPPLTAFHPCVC
jgi:hypothetical protein